MRLTANRAKLFTAVATVLHTAGSDARGLLQAAKKIGCTLLASGADGGAVYEFDGVTVKEDGDAVFALNSVAAVLRGSHDETVDLDTLPNSRMVLRTGSGRLELPTREPSSIDTGPPESFHYPTVDVEGSAFRRAVSRVVFAADRRAKPASWATSGVRIALRREALTLEATDTYGLALCRIPVKAGQTGETLLPVRTVRAWSEAARGRENVVLALGPSLATFRAGPLFAWSASITGRFPPLEDLLRAARPHGLTVPPRELLAAVELSMVAADGDEGIDPRDRRLTLKAQPRALTVSATSEQATARFEVPAAGYRGGQFTVPLHGRRVVEYLAVVEQEEKVAVRWQDARSAIEFAAGEDSWYLAIPFVEREE